MIELHKLEPLTMPSKTGGVYFTQLASGEIKIGSATDIAIRHRDSAFKGSRLLALLPGWRGVEADLHARFREHRSRDEGYLARETYRPVAPIAEVIHEIRAFGFTAQDLRSNMWKGASRELLFDDGQMLQLVVTYLPFIEKNKHLPRYILEHVCPGCKQPRSSLDFLNDFSVEELGQRSKRKYLVLHSSAECSSCMAATKLPAALAFPGGRTSIRIGRLITRSGEYARGYDRDGNRWLPIHDFGLRRMSKKARAGHKNDVSTLRLQPSIGRGGLAQGRPASPRESAPK